MRKSSRILGILFLCNPHKISYTTSKSGLSFKITEDTGKKFLQIPLPNQETLDKIVQADSVFLKTLIGQ